MKIHKKILAVLTIIASTSIPCLGSDGMESISVEMNTINEPGVTISAPAIKAETRVPLEEYGGIYDLVPPEDRIQFDMLTQEEVYKLQIELQASHTKLIIDMSPEDKGNVSLIKEYYDDSGDLIAKMVDTRNVLKGNVRKWFDKDGNSVSEVKYPALHGKRADIMRGITAEDLNDEPIIPAAEPIKQP